MQGAKERKTIKNKFEFIFPSKFKVYNLKN